VSYPTAPSNRAGATSLDARSFPLDLSFRCLKYGIQHRFGQSAGKRVLLAGMIATQQPSTVIQFNRCAVRKLGACRRSIKPCALDDFWNCCLPGQRSKCQNDDRITKFQSLGEKWLTIRQFLFVWLIAWWGASADVRDGRIDQFESITTGIRMRLIGKSSAMHRPIKPVTTPIAGKHATRSIGAVGSGCQTYNQQSNVWSTEIGNWFAPVFLVEI